MDAAAGKGKFSAVDGGDLSLSSSISSAAANSIVTAADSINMGSGASKKAHLMKELFG